jgi:hypothetical protein
MMTGSWCDQIWSIWCVATGVWSTSLLRSGETFAGSLQLTKVRPPKASELAQGCSSLPPLVAWNGSWNEWPRISSAISASRAVCRAVYAGTGPAASSRASRNAPLPVSDLRLRPRTGYILAPRCCLLLLGYETHDGRLPRLWHARPSRRPGVRGWPPSPVRRFISPVPHRLVGNPLAQQLLDLRNPDRRPFSS